MEFENRLIITKLDCGYIIQNGDFQIAKENAVGVSNYLDKWLNNEPSI